MKKVYNIIPHNLRAHTMLRLLLSLCATALDLASVVGFIPLLMLITNPSVMASNQFANRLYVASGAGSELHFMLMMAILLFVVLTIKNIVLLRISYSCKRLSMRLFESLSLSALENIYRRGLLYIRNHNSSRLINGIGSTTLVFASQVVGGWITIISESFMLLLIMLFVAWYDIEVFGALLLIFVPFFVLYTRFLRRRVQELGRTEHEIRIQQGRILSGAIRGYTDVKITGSLPQITESYGQLLKSLAKPSARGDILREIPAKLIEMVLLLGIILMLLIQNGGSSTVVTLGLFVVAAYKIMPAINRIMGAWSGLQRSEYATEYCSEITTSTEPKKEQKKEQTQESTQESTKSPAQESAQEPFSEIKLSNITFGYRDDAAIFKDFSLTIYRGQRVLINGVSGRGKSTLLNIIMGFLSPQKGCVTINGEPFNESYLSKFGYVSQDIFIMDDTLLANITMNDEPRNIDRQRLAMIWQWLSLDGMGVGVNDQLREWGTRLSGGQRQRIAMARALYRGAEILVLDEPTSSLDAQAECEILATLAAQNSDLTIICVSHKDFENSAINLFQRVETI